MKRTSYFDSPSQEEREVAKALEILKNNPGFTIERVDVLIHHEEHDPRDVFDACQEVLLQEKTPAIPFN